MKKEHFAGTYFKGIASDGFPFAIIQSHSSVSGDGLQLILKDASYDIEDPSSAIREGDRLTLNIHQGDLSIEGTLEIKEKHPLSHHAMGPFKIFSMQCCHEVFSMYHEVHGSLIVNGVEHFFNPGIGYCEGDSGLSFPSEYFWYNAIGTDYGVTLAYATIPFGPIKFRGLLGFINDGHKEYRLCTYTFAKVTSLTDNSITLKKGRYTFKATWEPFEGHPLRAPQDGKMDRTILESLIVPTSFELKKGKKTIFKKEACLASIEKMDREALKNKKAKI